MNEEKIFKLVNKMYADLKGSQEKMYADLKGSQEKMYAEMKEGFKHVDERLTSVEKAVSKLEKTVSKIEVEHGQKLSALFDGYVQNSDKLDRIEAEVAKHEEYILKRLK